MAERPSGRGAVNPDCPNAANRFHRCAAYCPVPVPAPAPAPAAKNGTGEAGGRPRGPAVNPACPNAANPFHRCAEYCPVPAPAPAAVKTFPLPPSPPPGREVAQNGTTHGDGDLQPTERRRDGDEHSPVPAPAPAPAAVKSFPPPPSPSPSPGRELAPNGRTQSDGDLRPTERRRDRAGGSSGGLPLYVFLREGSDGEGKKVDPRCPNAANPFHVCTNHCLAKMLDAGRAAEGGGKSPISLFSRHSGRSTSSSEDGSVKSGASKKSDAKCPNAANLFHECGEHCAAKIKEADKRSPRTKGGKNISPLQNWKVDPRCPNAGNPFHICAQYCFDHLNGAAPTAPSKPDSRKGKAVIKAEPTGEINPDCANASNPYHKCGEYCKTNGNR